MKLTMVHDLKGQEGSRIVLTNSLKLAANQMSPQLMLPIQAKAAYVPGPT